MTSPALDALRLVDGLVKQHASYDEFIAALERCRQLPGAELLLPGIAQRKLSITTMFSRGLEDTEQALVWLLEVTPDPVARASSALVPCRRFPDLARRYLPTVLQDLEREADAPGELLGLVRDVLAREGQD